MEEQRSHAVIESVQDPLGFDVLLACVCARQAEQRTVFGEEGAQGEVAELTPVVCLHGKDGVLEPCLNVSVEVSKNKVHIKSVSKRKGPYVMHTTVSSTTR